MNKYERIVEELNSVGFGKIKLFGNSMNPLIKSGSLITFKKVQEYEIDDIVLCKVKSRFLSHKIIKKDRNRGYLIANNHGFENGWTKSIYGKVIQSEWGNELKSFL